ncbi:MAG: hypothetical protein LBK44_05440 [Spirochaetales bacterium]|nr:hypothetical protein [Spirochaetales bacterium]
MRFLWAFRCNAPEDGRFPIGMDCSGRYRAPGIPCARTSGNSRWERDMYSALCAVPGDKPASVTVYCNRGGGSRLVIKTCTPLRCVLGVKPRNFGVAKLRPPGYTQLIAKGN